VAGQLVPLFSSLKHFHLARVRSLEEFTTVCYTLNQAVTDSIHTSIKILLIRPRSDQGHVRR